MTEEAVPQELLDQLVELIGPIVTPLIERTESAESKLEIQTEAFATFVDRLDENDEELTSHGKILQELVERLDNLSKNDGKKKPSPWNLYDGDQKKLAEVFKEIQQWIPWFNRTYGFPHSSNMIPSCWFRHPRLVPELVGLYISWKAANYGSTSPDSDLVYWNLRYLPDVLAKFRDHELGSWNTCTPEEHVEPASIDPVPEPDDEGFTAWLNENYSVASQDDSPSRESVAVDDPYKDLPPPPEPEDSLEPYPAH